MRASKLKNERVEIKKWSNKIKQKKIKYETNK